MNEHIVAMENLLRAKKENNKKEPTIAEKTDFMKEWTALVMETGYPGKAEQFLYDGFSFCGAEPFYQFLKQSEDQENVIKQLFGGKYYGKDSNVTFRVVVHLFALMVNDNASANLLEGIIRHFSPACLNKEGKRLGTATKTMEKYFLNVLSLTAELPSLKDMNLNPGVTKIFLSTVSSLLNELKQMDSIKEPAVSNLLRVEEWGKAYFESEVESGIRPTNRTTTEESDVKQNSSSVEETQTVNVNSLDSVLNQAVLLASRLQKENDSQRHRIIGLETKEHDNDLKLTEAVKELESERKAASELRSQIFELESQCRMQKKEIEDKERLLREKDAEIAERIKMSEVLSRDRSRQADESLQRIASKIRIEYRDFMDAIDTPMTVDLGENLRLQLQNVFEILEKGGLKIE